MEDTLGDLGENSGHGVIARLRILIQKLDHFQAITHELTTQEFIDQENLANDICKRRIHDCKLRVGRHMVLLRPVGQ